MSEEERERVGGGKMYCETDKTYSKKERGGERERARARVSKTYREMERETYRAAKSDRMPYFCGSFSAKEPYD